MMRADIAAHEMDKADVLAKLRVQCIQKGDKFPLSLPFITLPIDLARTGVKGGKEIEGTGALLLVLVPVGTVLWLGWQGWGATRSRLQGGLLVHRQHQFIRTQRPRVEGNQLRHGDIEGGIPRLFGITPDMLPPGFQLMRGQNPAYSGSGDLFHDPLRDELPRQLGTIPLGETAAQRIRALAGQAYHVERDLGGKIGLGPAARGVGKPVQTLGEKALGPSTHHCPLDTHRARHV